MDGKRAVIYDRISSDREGAGVKVEDQETDNRALAARLGLEVVEGIGYPKPDGVFTDNDISAYSGKPRPGYRALLDAIRAGQVDVVLTLHTDRLHRPREWAELEEYIDLSERYGIATHTVRAGTLDLSTSSGRMTARIHAAVNRAETEHQIERLRDARVHKAARGGWGGGRRPFGYDLTPDPNDRRPQPRHTLVINEREADALRWAASETLAGTSLSAVCAKLNAKGIRTSTGKEWKPTELRRALVRPSTAGLMQHQTCGQKQRRGEHHHTEECSPIVGKAEWTAILDEDIWRGVRAVLGDPDRRTNTSTGRRWLLAGLAHCGVCGAPVKSFSASARRRPTRPVYTCRSGKHVIRTAEEVDSFVEQVVVGILVKRGAELLAPDQTGDTTALHLRDAALRARLEEYERLAGAGAIEPSSFVRITADIRRQREEVTEQLAAMSRGSVLAGVADAADPAKVWAGLDLSRKREIIRVLMTVTILPSRRGRRPGWRPGESYFDPATVELTPLR
jgi:site-specific DNA recombinase